MSDPKYDVFLSFRGEDTREKFTSHLYAELDRQNIGTFIDYRIETGDKIHRALIEAIEESLIYVVILSEHYASSRWCLDELIKILECKEKYGREVIPLFYEVDPTDVRKQTGSYGQDFLEHHEHRPKDKIDAWKAALTEVADLKGLESKKISPENTLVEKISEDILKKLNRHVSSNYYEGMAAIDKHIKQFQSLMHLESSKTIRIIGIWGMGGIGKTTIASAIFEKLATQFSSKSIIRNVQQEIERVGLSHVKKEYLSQLLNETITSSESNSYDQRLKRTKGLIVFDDLKDADQLQDLIGTRHKFGQGSRIIVTSRNKQVLENANVDEIYQVREMNDQDSLQLFCSFAFKQNHPKESFVSLTEKVLDYANGLPLALKVLGSMLYGKANEVWESQLRKLKELPDLQIFKLLKLSYDGLDDEQKDIFLDIACFYRGEFKKVVELTLDSFSFSACKGMDDLKDRGLISISEGRVWMHDLIQEMGHEIVRLENKNHPGKRSRLWKAEDIYDVLSKNKGTNAIQCIDLNMDKKKKVQLNAETFKEMHNLRMIRFKGYVESSNMSFHAFLKSFFPDDLKLFYWNNFPERSLPQDFCPKNLVTLEMRESRLEQLWEGDDKALPNLKRLNLVDSMYLVRVPDLSLFPNIEELVLSGCESLIQVYSSSFLSNLHLLCLKGCTELKSLTIPSNILSRSSGFVTLSGCSKLETLSISGGADVIQSYICSNFYLLDHLKYDDMRLWLYDEGGYKIWGFYMCVINELCWLDISYCESLTCLPAELFNSKFLRRLSLSGCLKLEVLPEIMETMENLKVLILDKTAIKELPSSLHHLVGLEILSLRGCTKLKTIPSSIGNLSKLVELDFTNCNSLETFPSSIFKLKLTTLSFYGCSMLRTFTEILEPEKSCVHINLTETTIKEPPSVRLWVELVELNLKLKPFKLNFTNCESLETFPSSIFKLKLKKLKFKGCSMLRTFPEILEPAESFTCINLAHTAIKELPSSLHLLIGLENLVLRGCTKLKIIPSSIGNLNKLFELDLTDCESLETFPGSIFKLKLTKLDLQGCSMLRTFPEIPNDGACLSSLTELSLSGSGIVNLPESLAHLSSLKSLDLSDCKLLECVPNNIGCLSSLTELSLEGSSIVNLPESLAHLSSLKSLYLSDCKLLECVPNLPPNLYEVLAYDCPSIKRMMLNSRSDFEKGSFKFHLTNTEGLDAASLRNIEEEAYIKINDDAYWSVFFCLPGSTVPNWFSHLRQGHSITIRKDHLNLSGRNRLIGFALGVVLGPDFPCKFSWIDPFFFRYQLKFESDGQTHFHPNNKLEYDWKYKNRRLAQHHTILWKYRLDLATIFNGFIDAETITFEILDGNGRPLSFPTTMTVKECGICPLYSSKENDDDDDA